MAPADVEQLSAAISAAKTAVSNARDRGRLRGESLELLIALERLTEAEALMAAVAVPALNRG